MKKVLFIINLVMALLIIPCAVAFGFIPVFSGGLTLIENLPLSFFMFVSLAILIVDETASIFSVIMLFALFAITVIAVIVFMFLSYFKSEKFAWGVYIPLGLDIIFKLILLTTSFAAIFGILFDVLMLVFMIKSKKETIEI